MGAGEIGPNGQNVLSAAEAPCEKEQDYAITPLHRLEEMIARSMAPLTLKVKDATTTHARVC